MIDKYYRAMALLQEAQDILYNIRAEIEKMLEAKRK